MDEINVKKCCKKLFAPRYGDKEPCNNEEFLQIFCND